MATGGLRHPHAYPMWMGYAGWFLAAMFFFYAWILRVAPSVMVGDLMRDFMVTATVVGNLSAIYFYVYAPLQLPVGIALDRWGPRRVLTAAALLAGAGALLFAMSDSVWMASIGRGLIGAGAAFGYVGSLVLAAAWFPPHRFAFLSGLCMGIGLLGGIGGQGPLAALVDWQGWRVAMYALGALALLLSAAIWALMRDRPERAPPVEAPALPVEPAEPMARMLIAVMRRPQTIFVALYAATMSTSLLGFGALWGVPFTMELYGVSRPVAGFTVSIMLFGFVLGGPAWGWVSDRIARRRSPMLAGAVLAGGALTAALYVPGLPLDLFRVLLFVAGFAAGTMAISYAAAREHNAKGLTGSALGLINMCAVLSGALLQPVMGAILDANWEQQMVDGARVYPVSAYATAFLILPAAYLVAAVSAFLVRETYCRPAT